MQNFFYQKVIAVDWVTAFIPSVALLDVVTRGSIIYLCLFSLLHLTRRHSGEINTSDVLVIALIADAVQNGMAGDYKSITEGVTLALTIFFWSWLLEWLPVRFPSLRPLLVSEVSIIVSEGVVDQRELRRGLMTMDNLQTQLRLQGIDDIEDVVCARIEPNGRISIQRKV